MAESNEDPRETPLHPRFAAHLFGHAKAEETFTKAFASGRPHHAWLIHGQFGIGKATLAYRMARLVLGDDPRAKAWIDSRSHPDLFVLERQLNDQKPRKLKSEISVEDARALSAFLAKTASGNWRIVIIDAVDDLNAESANAILKLVEEPPAKTLIMLIANQLGRVLRTLRSRCLPLGLASLNDNDVINVITGLPLDPKVELQAIEELVAEADGSPGRALTLLDATGAAAFVNWKALQHPKLSELVALSTAVARKGDANDGYSIFTGLLLDWMANKAKSEASGALAEAHAAIAGRSRIVQGYNLDRRQAALGHMRICMDALKAS